jgi:hypothetical protein
VPTQQTALRVTHQQLDFLSLKHRKLEVMCTLTSTLACIFHLSFNRQVCAHHQYILASRSFCNLDTETTNHGNCMVLDQQHPETKGSTHAQFGYGSSDFHVLGIKFAIGFSRMHVDGLMGRICRFRSHLDLGSGLEAHRAS